VDKGSREDKGIRKEGMLKVFKVQRLFLAFYFQLFGTMVKNQ